MTARKKRCPRCTHTKSADAFYPRPGRASGLSSWCISCHRAYPDPPPDLPGAKPEGDPLVAYLLDRRRQAAARLGVETVPCLVCTKHLARLDYSKSQWRSRNTSPPTCLDCQAARRRKRADEKRMRLAAERATALTKEGVDILQTLTCVQCGEEQGIVYFSRGQWEKDKPRCRRCVGDYQRLRAEIREEERRTEQFRAGHAEDKLRRLVTAPDMTRSTLPPKSFKPGAQ